MIIIKNYRQRASSSVMALFFVSIFSMIGIAFTAMSQTSIQTSVNHQNAVEAQIAAESGLHYAFALLAGYTPPSEVYTPRNTVTNDDAGLAFTYFRSYVDATVGAANTVWDQSTLSYSFPAAGTMPLDNTTSAGFQLQFQLQYATESTPAQLTVISTGRRDQIQRQARMTMNVKKDGQVLEYAIASRGRMIVTGDTTINGDIYSAWPRPDYQPPFETTSETVINGSVSTLITQEQLDQYWISLETLDENGNPTYNPYDTLQGYYESVNYGVDHDVPGLSVDDYDTSMYVDLTSNMPASGRTEVEYFPHAPGHYDLPKSASSVKLNRQVYEDRTYTNKCVATGRNALFRRCTFNGIFYINMSGNGTNNVRFEDCVFNGPIITGVPQDFNWMQNALYFTGTATFNNTYMPETTILAPHFNVNLGNTAEVEVNGGSTLTGAIVGGIVDVRGNAQIDGTIISMYDTSPHRYGYVTNIGFADDGGNESSALDPEDDIGVIRITPDPSRLLPSGIITPIIFSPNPDSYVEL